MSHYVDQLGQRLSGNNNCVTEPESGEVTCPEDFFTFGVTDDCGDLGTAIVGVNGGTEEPPLDPGF